MEFQLLFHWKKYEIKCPIRSEMEEGPRKGSPHSSSTTLYSKTTRTPREPMTGTSMLTRAKIKSVANLAKSHQEDSTNRTRHSMTYWAWVHQLLVMAVNNRKQLSSRPTSSLDRAISRVRSTLACRNLPNSLAINRCQPKLSRWRKSSLLTSSATSEAMHQLARMSRNSINKSNQLSRI